MHIKARSKMISFRLSTEEYEQFREICLAQGIANISELARAAVHRLMRERAPEPTTDSHESRISNLEGQMHMLTLELRRLKQSADAPRNGAAAATAVAG